MNSKILVIDDDPYILHLLQTILQNEFEVVAVSDSQIAMDIFKKNTPDLILLDIMMPKVDGFEILNKVRQIDPYVPVIMLSAKSQTEDKVFSLCTGADDYITKPFKKQELLARIKSALRRATLGNKPSEPQIITARNLSIDILNEIVYKNQKVVPLSKMEFTLLKIMALNANKILERKFLYKSVWEYDYTKTSRTLDNFIRSIRKKIEDNPAKPEFIKTIHGKGYEFINGESKKE